MADSVRDPRTGKFVPGNKAAVGRGTGTRARRLAQFQALCTDEQWTAIVSKNLRDALGMRRVTVPTPSGPVDRLEDDPNSDPGSRARARDQIYDYMLGRAPQPIEISEEESSTSVLNRYSDDELDVLVAAAKSLRGSAQDRGERSGDGVSEAESTEDMGEVSRGA